MSISSRFTISIATIARIATTMSSSAIKRKANEPVSPPAIKRKVQSTTSKTAVANFFTPSSQKPKPRTIWSERAPPNSTSPPTLLIGRYTPETLSDNQDQGHQDEVIKKKRKVAAFDLDSTLIVTSSGKKHSDGAADWKWWDTAIVPKRLRDLYHRDGYLVALFSNQGGIMLHADPNAKGPKNAGRAKIERANSFKTKCNAVFEALDIPVIIYAATGKDIFRKPRPGMWSAMCEDLAIPVSELDLESSFFVGDAGGRTAVMHGGSGKGKAAGSVKDFSCSDRNFAHNVGVPFLTPEAYFHGKAEREFVRDVDMGKYPFSGEVPEGFEKGERKEVLLFCGPPGAGKSTFYRRYLEEMGYKRVNQDILKTKDKCLKVAAEHLQGGSWVVVDNTNADPGTRGQWVSLAQKHKVPIRCVWFKTPLPLCEHNDAVRAMNGGGSSGNGSDTFNPENREILPKLAFNGFASRYKEPKMKEGFDEVIEVDFKFRGSEEEHRIWSQYWI